MDQTMCNNQYKCTMEILIEDTWKQRAKLHALLCRKYSFKWKCLSETNLYIYTHTKKNWERTKNTRSNQKENNYLYVLILAKKIKYGKILITDNFLWWRRNSSITSTVGSRKKHSIQISITWEYLRALWTVFPPKDLCIYLYGDMCRGQKSLCGSSGAEVIGSCILPNVMLESELRFSGRIVRAFNHWAIKRLSMWAFANEKWKAAKWKDITSGRQQYGETRDECESYEWTSRRQRLLKDSWAEQNKCQKGRI